MFKSKRTGALRVACAIVATATVAAALSGCTGGTGNGSKTLTYWSMWKQGEPQQVVLDKAIKGFTAKTGIKVNVQWSGRQVLQQIVPRLAAGNPPDLFDNSGTGVIAGFAGKDALLGLGDVYAATPDGESKKLSELIPATLSDLVKSKDGQPALVPYEITGNSLWYNARKTPELEGKSTISWQDFMTIADKLKADGKPPIAIDGDQAYYDAYWFVFDAVRRGGPEVFINLAKDKTGAAADDPAILQAAKDIFPLTQGGYLPSDFNGTKFPAQEVGWAAGTNKTSFLLMGSWAPSETAAGLKKSGIDPASVIKYASLPFPTVDGGKGNDVTWIDDFGFAIPKKAKNAENAKEFIKFFMAKKQLTGISTIAINLTPRADVPVPPDLAGFAKEYQAGAAANALSNNVDAGLVNSQWQSNVLDATVADMFNKKFSSPEAFVAALKSRTIDFFKTQG